MRYMTCALLAVAFFASSSLGASQQVGSIIPDYGDDYQRSFGQPPHGKEEVLVPILNFRAQPAPIGPTAYTPYLTLSGLTVLESDPPIDLHFRHFTPPDEAFHLCREMDLHSLKPHEEAQKCGLLMIPKINALESAGIHAMRQPYEFNQAWDWLNQKLQTQMTDVEVGIAALKSKVGHSRENVARITNEIFSPNDRIVDDESGLQERMQNALISLGSIKSACEKSDNLRVSWLEYSRTVYGIRRNYLTELDKLRFSVVMCQQWINLMKGGHS